MEQQMFPAVINCFAATPARSVKVSATQCLTVLVKRNVSKQLIIDNLIPALRAMKTRDPVVVVAVGDLWKDVCTRLNSEQIFTLGLPHLLEISLAKQLTVDQFKHLMTIVNSEIETVSKEQIKLLVNNEPADDDDWLNEPVSVTGPTNASSSDVTTTAPSSSSSKEPPSFGVSPLTAPSPSVPPLSVPPLSSPSSTPSSATLAPSKPSFGAVPVLNSSNKSASVTSGNVTPALNNKPDSPKTYDTLVATKKNKEIIGPSYASTCSLAAIETERNLNGVPSSTARLTDL